MGILVDLFVANTEDAARFEESSLCHPNHFERFQPIEYKGLTNLAFGSLWAVLENKPFDIRTHDLELRPTGESGESLLFRFPNQLVGRLAHLGASEIEAKAIAWSQAEKELAGWHVEDAKALIKDLVALANGVHGAKLGLYFSLSL